MPIKAEIAEPVSAGPTLGRDNYGNVDYDSVPDVIQWFLDFDQRVAIIKHPRVEELFHWKQQETRSQGEDVFVFNHAEDRLAIGIIQALAHNPGEPQLHAWIAQLLNALDAASKATESVVADYGLNVAAEASVVAQYSRDALPFDDPHSYAHTPQGCPRSATGCGTQRANRGHH